MIFRVAKLLLASGTITAKGQMCHDLRVPEHAPNYVKKELMGLNSLLLMGGEVILKPLLEWEEEFTVEKVAKVLGNYKKEIVQDYEHHQKQKFQTKTKPFLSGIIAFTNKEKQYCNNYLELLDYTAIKFIDDFCKSKHTKCVYLVRHSDETSVHYHFMLLDYNFEKHTTIKFSKVDLSYQQTRLNREFKVVFPHAKRGKFRSHTRHTTRAEHLSQIEQERDRLKEENDVLTKHIKKLEVLLKTKKIPFDEMLA